MQQFKFKNIKKSFILTYKLMNSKFFPYDPNNYLYRNNWLDSFLYDGEICL